VLKAASLRRHFHQQAGIKRLPRLSAIMAASMLLATLGTTVLAQGNSYPQRPLKLIAPTSPGGAPGSTGRRRLPSTTITRWVHWPREVAHEFGS